MKAFVCHNDFEHHSIIYAETRNKAKWQFIQGECDGDWSGVSIRREKRLDEFSDSRNIPFKELIWLGWWTECAECGMHMDEDTMDEEEKDVDGVIGHYHGNVYCSKKCFDDDNERRAEEKLMADRLTQHLIWKLQDRFGADSVEHVRTSARTAPIHKRIVYAEIEAKIDGLPVLYGTNFGDKDAPLYEDWKRMTHNLRLAPKDLPYFEEKYGLVVEVS